MCLGINRSGGLWGRPVSKHSLQALTRVYGYYCCCKKSYMWATSEYNDGTEQVMMRWNVVLL